MSNFENINLQDISGKNDNTYADFKEKLMAVEEFPSMYVFKFVVPTSDSATAQIEKIFEHPSTKITTKQSGGSKYESFTIQSFVKSADDVINYYKEVSKIDKVIML